MCYVSSLVQSGVVKDLNRSDTLLCEVNSWTHIQQVQQVLDRVPGYTKLLIKLLL